MNFLQKCIHSKTGYDGCKERRELVTGSNERRELVTGSKERRELVQADNSPDQQEGMMVIGWRQPEKIWSAKLGCRISWHSFEGNGG